MNRKTSLSILLGTNGTGKTSFLRKLADTEIKNGGRVLILTVDSAEWTDFPEIESFSIFNGIAKVIHRPGVLDKIFKTFFDGLLIFDDYRSFGITATGKEAEALRAISIRRRQHMIDIAIAGHGFTEIVPSFLFTFATHLVLFKTIDNVDKVKNRLPKFEFIKKQQNEVNTIANDENAHYYRIIRL